MPFPPVVRYSVLTKLGYFIDNPWNNRLGRAIAAGSVLADVLLHRNLGVRPVTLIGFSLGAQIIYYALLQLAKHKAHGIVLEDVFLMGVTISVSRRCEMKRGVCGGVGTVAGLRPIEGVSGLENVDVKDKIAGHMSYRTFIPLILDQLGFPVFADYLDEPEDPDFEGDHVVVQEKEEQTKKGWFSRRRNLLHLKTCSDRRQRPAFHSTRNNHQMGGTALTPSSMKVCHLELIALPASRLLMEHKHHPRLNPQLPFQNMQDSISLP
ncbi:hypothetical protein PM082_004088 [Marasmius tenuissimus]|nr:hypothetical protein PM082_004088 [Marasmius tenuissimus]